MDSLASTLIGDCRDVLPGLPDASVHCVITSPPYYGLRDYGTSTWEGGDPTCPHEVKRHNAQTRSPASQSGKATGEDRLGRTHCRCGAARRDSQIGLESTVAGYIDALVGVFREVRRVLRHDGTVWLNLGDTHNSYNGNAKQGGPVGANASANRPKLATGAGLLDATFKSKDLMLIPHRVVIALQEDGWYVRSTIVWHKPNPMPESARDRPTKAHEYLFLLTKSARYFYDGYAIMEPIQATAASLARMRYPGYDNGGSKRQLHGPGDGRPDTITPHKGRYWPDQRNKRDVWTVATEPYPNAHFATFPQELITPCVLAGTSAMGACADCGAPWRRIVERVRTVDGEEVPDLGAWRTDSLAEQDSAQGLGHWRISTRVIERGWEPTCDCASPADPVPCVILDPFVGSGTTQRVSSRFGRRSIGIDLSPRYGELVDARTSGVQMEMSW